MKLIFGTFRDNLTFEASASKTPSNRTSQRTDAVVTVGVVSTEKCWVIQAQSGCFQTAELWNEFVSEGRWREQPALALPLL